MYKLPEFTEKDEALVKAFIRQHSFAMLIGSRENIPAATQVPFLIEDREGQLFLQGHIMRNTDHHKAFQTNANVLCVFTGAHSYVSASWYTNPQSGSTWNYMSVQARGVLRFLDHDALLHILERTTTHYENNEQSPASFRYLPDDYIEQLSKAIVGIEIEVKTLEPVFKLSQNQDETSYNTIIQQLEKGEAGAKQVAEEMKQRQSKLFKSK